MRDGGKVKLYTLSNTATAGFMPTEKLVKQSEAFISFVTVGVTRMYAAIGANREFDFVVRCWNTPRLPDGVKYAILENGNQYRIDRANSIVDDDATELYLVRLEDFYDVAAE